MEIPAILVVDQTRRYAGWSPGIDALVVALQHFVDQCLMPVWGTPCQLRVAGELAPSAWALALFDDLEQPGLLGVHELTSNGYSIAKVAVGSIQRHRRAISIVASHELAEMLVDPDAMVAVKDDQGQLVALECCDPVEEESFLIDGLPMCNFVFPAWFGPVVGARYADPRGKLDYLGLTTRPFQPLQRGYIPVFDGVRWSRRFGGDEKAAEFAREDRYGRRGELRRHSPGKQA